MLRLRQRSDLFSGSSIHIDRERREREIVLLFILGTKQRMQHKVMASKTYPQPTRANRQPSKRAKKNKGKGGRTSVMISGCEGTPKSLPAAVPYSEVSVPSALHSNYSQ